MVGVVGPLHKDYAPMAPVFTPPPTKAELREKYESLLKNPQYIGKDYEFDMAVAKLLIPYDMRAQKLLTTSSEAGQHQNYYIPGKKLASLVFDEISYAEAEKFKAPTWGGLQTYSGSNTTEALAAKQAEQDAQKAAYNAPVDTVTVVAPAETAAEKAAREKLEVAKKQAALKAAYLEQLKKKQVTPKLQAGGTAHDPTNAAMALVLMHRNKTKPMVDRAINPTESVQNTDGSYSTHSMATTGLDSQGILMYPTVIPKNNTLTRVPNKEAVDYAFQTKDAVLLPAYANKFAEYMSTAGYKLAANKLAGKVLYK
jgi:hypothetical protein